MQTPFQRLKAGLFANPWRLAFLVLVVLVAVTLIMVYSLVDVDYHARAECTAKSRSYRPRGADRSERVARFDQPICRHAVAEKRDTGQGCTDPL